MAKPTVAAPRKRPAKATPPAASRNGRMPITPTAVPVAGAGLPTSFGAFRIQVYRDVPTGKEHAAIVKGDVSGPEPVLVRVHSECLTGDIFGSLRCDCGPQLQEALRRIELAGRGVILYLRQEGRDIGLTNKILAYQLQEKGYDTAEANLQLGHPVDARTYDAARDILNDLGVESIRLLTNNPDKINALNGMGFDCVERVPLEIPSNKFNKGYLKTKKTKMGHLLGNQ
ncbi:MAG: 3,4-dihydroxy 2-butanone 4-phosphate synthase / cyclohydrolase [Thermoplasmata archaeon]|jgi:3,4-dihydroxy 2-butanone 4-phosphate synthase/GTP cyclohydrolase II|nr:3,4-dihydroxy 2-butanone 4-phosphate synthase / cyclohydrolase [Thermoplasmata archaeon]MEA3166473.1 3,4-dihydroxy 2-butanone 4-phosphate synthase / cyclohydrolase [Thermoplasmata archaeon]